MEDRSIQKNAFYISLVFTVIFWLLLLVIFAFAPSFQKKELYRPIQIILESPEESVTIERPQEVEKRKTVVPVEDAPKAEIASAEKPTQKSLERTSSAAVKTSSGESAFSQIKNASSESASSAQKGASQSTKNAPVQSASPPVSSSVEKSSEKSSQNASSKTSLDSEKKSVTYKKSMEELLEEQFEAAKDAQWDESVFEGDSVNEAVSQSGGNSASVASEALSGAEALSGTAGTASPGEKGAVAKADNPSQGSLAEASRETLSSLQRISEATYTAPEENGVVSSVSVNAATDSEGSVSIEMTDKSTRILLDPKKPYIILSEESASLIDSSRAVMIEFVVLPSGAVPFSRISFIPSSLLPQAVQSEIREQISKWRFSSASSEALARLEYNIKKR